MRKLSRDKRTAVLSCLTEGTSIRATCRLCGVSKLTVLRLYYAVPDGADRRYSPAVCIGTEKMQWIGNPKDEHICTSFVERANLTIRMRNRRFTRLTNAFSKKWTNHEHALALHFFVYNFVRKHQTTGTTPAMSAGIADRSWTVADLVDLLEREEQLRENGGRINRADRS